MSKKRKAAGLGIVLLVLLLFGVGNVQAKASFDLFGTLPKTAARTANKNPKILFVGNSLTYRNNFEQVFKKYCKSGGISPQVTMLVAGGHTLRQCGYPNKVNKADVQFSNQLKKLLTSQKWDYVVLQGQSYEAITGANGMEKALQVLQPLIKKAGAKGVLFLTWPVRSGHRIYSKLPVSDQDEFLSVTQSTYYNLAKKHKMALAPTGIAMLRGVYTMPDIQLYAKDDHHPSEMGTYLSASVMYATLFGKNPENSTYYPTFSGMSRMESRAACKRLQALAADVTVHGSVKNTATVKLASQESVLQAGTSEKLKYSILSGSEASRVASWTSSNPKVASVSASGRVTAKSEGVARITVRLNNNDSAYCTVTVVPSKLKMSAGEKYSLKNVDKLTWSSNQEAVATVESGMITAKKAGTAVLTGTAQDGTKVKVAVKVAGSIKSLTAEKNKVIQVGAKARLKVTAGNGKDAGYCTYTSSNPAVVAVNNSGVLQAKAAGKARITVTAGNGVKAVCDVRAIVPVKKIRIRTAVGLKMQKKTSQKLTVEFSPANASVKKVKWTSSDPKVAAVDASGNVKAVGKGTAVITAAAKDGSGQKASIKITVY